jgi:hypothetical protein
MSQLPIMTPFELTLVNDLNVEVQRFNNGWLFKWYGMTYEGGRTDVDDFRGGRISYAGIKFGSQQQRMFWGAIDRYLGQKVHAVFKQWDGETRVYSNEARRKSIDGVERTLQRFVGRIVADAKETDRRLRGKGFPQNVPVVDDAVARVYAQAEISNLAASHRMLLDQLIEKEELQSAAVLRKKSTTFVRRLIEDFRAETSIKQVGIATAVIVFLVGCVTTAISTRETWLVPTLRFLRATNAPVSVTKSVITPPITSSAQSSNSDPSRRAEVGRARFLYDQRSDTMVLINKQDLELATIEKTNDLGTVRLFAASGSSFVARFGFFQNIGPFEVEVNAGQLAFSKTYAASVQENEKNYVKIELYPIMAATSALTSPDTTTLEVTVIFYRR